MDNKRKNVIVLISCIAAVIFSVGVAFLGVKLIKFGSKEKVYEGVVVDGNYVDNGMNNQYFEFARIGDKLYYSHFFKGLYEISEDGAKHIYGGFMSEGFAFIRNIDGELYCEIGEKVKKYDPVSGKLVDQNEVKDIYSLKNGDITVDHRFDEDREVNMISITYKGELVKTIESSYYQPFYISGDHVYYISEGNKIECFNVKDKTDELVVDVGDHWIYTFVVEDGKIIFDAEGILNEHTYIYCIDLSDEERTLNNLFQTEETINFTVYDNKVYVCSTDGTLTKIDLETSEKTLLCKKESIDSCYIVDDKWVYFLSTDMTESLWRVTQDGKIIEKVFG